MAAHQRTTGDAIWSTVWITGASTGIGRALALLLNEEARHVAVSARSREKLDELASNAKAISAYPLDVTDHAATELCVRRIEAGDGPIDLAVLNAGVWHMMDAKDLKISAVCDAVDVNLMGVYHALDALLPRMIARRRGHIAIVASVAGYRGLPKSIAYGPTKAALINLAETLKAELRPYDIVVSLVNPGFVDTPMTRGNPFPMPGLMPADKAAKELLAGLKRRRFEITFPRGFATAVKLLRLVPDRLYFWLVRRFILSRQDAV